MTVWFRDNLASIECQATMAPTSKRHSKGVSQVSDHCPLWDVYCAGVGPNTKITVCPSPLSRTFPPVLPSHVTLQGHVCELLSDTPLAVSNVGLKCESSVYYVYKEMNIIWDWVRNIYSRNLSSMVRFYILLFLKIKGTYIKVGSFIRIQ